MSFIAENAERPSTLTRNHAKNGFISLFSIWSWRVLIGASILQCLIWNTSENIFAIFVVLFAWKLVTKFILRYDVLNRYALSSFIIFGYVFTQFYVPLIATLLEFKPIVFNLKLPFEVFLHSLIDIIVIIFCHLAYRQIRGDKKLTSIQKVLINAKFFKAPNNYQIWIMGFVGLAAMFYSTLGAERGQEITGNGNKFVEGFIPFVYAPFYIFLTKLFDKSKPVKPEKIILKIILYTILIFALSIMRNSRGALMYGFTGLGYGYLLGLFLNFYPPKIFNKRNLIVGFTAIWLIVGPLADLGIAMLLARASRGAVSASELLSETLSIYNNKDLINRFNSRKNMEIGEWDETYLSNLYLARLSNLKLSDASLVQAEKIGESDSDIRNYSIERVLATLPQPVIDMFGINIDKKNINSHSFGDYLYEKAGGENALGGFRTGHFDGTGMAAFGWFYLVVLGAGLVPVFYLIDQLQIAGDFWGDKPVFSLCGLLALITMFTFIVSESVINVYVYLIRGWLQMVFLYFIVYHVSQMFSNLFNKGN